MLSKYGSPAETVFDLLGHKEVDLTAALGWVLSQSPALLSALARELGMDEPGDEIGVALEVIDSEGRTDIELTTATTKVVIEAKKGWLVPGDIQLTKYTGRFDGFEHALLVSLSDSSEHWACTLLPSTANGIPVRHIAWDLIRSEIATSRASANQSERRWLNELETYMGTATSVRPPEDQRVYCVVLNDTLLGGITLKDYARRERAYFHPFGGNNTWPKIPPTFLCFRWGGKVRQVNRVERFEVIQHLSERWPSITATESAGAHIIYGLGPDIPIPDISTKGTYANGRVWCLLDQLLTQPTLAEAVQASKELGA